MDIRIRPCLPADGAACTRIFDQAWHAGHPYAPRQIDRAAFERETIGERVMVAEDGAGQVVGFVSLHEAARFIHHLYVAPALQGRGVGRRLLEHAVVLAGGKASLKCQRRNPQAMGFYARLGWTPGEEGEAETGAWVRMHSP